MHVVYVCTLLRTVIGLHNLINNRISTREIEIEQAKKEKEDQKKKEEEATKKVADHLAREEEEAKKAQ